ncbi:O-methyltransferase [Trifolium pratense]|uniref:O-methyltransferase n=1 Tax=Trifolium pratense TaxID=57577 RepID=A0A2K3P2A5_TRIPR|nr:O-methyltransferase [Trifolium pratense]
MGCQYGNMQRVTLNLTTYSIMQWHSRTGTMAKALAKSFPKIECKVFDLPHVVDGLQGNDNLNYVGGDMFKKIPPTDAILLKECVKILKNCKDAIAKKGKEGKVIIIDMVREKEKGNDETIETQLSFDMLMMVLFTAKERNKEEWIKLISLAGFSNYKITPVLGLRSVIEIYP